MRRMVLMCCVLLVVSLSAASALADLGISVYVDKSTYTVSEDNLVMSVSGYNSGDGVNVDVHIAVLPPGGGILEVPDWNMSFNPLLPNVFLPSGFDYPQADLGTYMVGNYPFNLEGDYLFAAAFTEAGTLNFLGDIAFAPFTVEEAAGDWSAGGCQIMWDHWYDYDDDLQWETDVSAGGAFVSLPERPDYYQDYYALPIDTCEYVVYVPTSDGFPGFTDAGDHIDMRGGPFGTFRMDKETRDYYVFTETHYGPGLGYELGVEDYVVGGTYTFEGYGGPDVGPFEVSVVAPEVLEVYSPDISSKPTIDRSSDLLLSWNGVGEGYVQFLIGYETLEIWTQQYSVHTCYCRFTDDGEAVVPASVLSQLPDWNPDPFSLTRPPEMGIYRMNITEYSTTGLQHGFGVALAGITRDVELD